jgi:ATP-dependent Clp protease ATP-binding subunit ClpA
MQNQGSFDRFTERARKVLTLAQEEAQRFNHNYIGTEHLLLGLVREGEGVAAKVLSNLGIELTKVRSAVEFIIGRGERQVMGDIGLTPRAKKVIELAVDEARRLGHHYIGTEHLLLGLIREGEGIAAGVLESLGVNLEKVRSEVIKVLMQTGPSPAEPGSVPPRPYPPRPANPTPDTWEYLAVPVQEQETEPDTRALICSPPLQAEMLPEDITGMHVQHVLRLLGSHRWELAAIDPAYGADGGRESLYIFKRQQRTS